MTLSDRIPKHTRRFETISKADVEGVGRIIAAKAATEDRGQLTLWTDIAAEESGRVVWIDGITREDISVQLDSAATSQTLSLHDAEGILTLLGSTSVLIDISGLPHHVWAPLLKSAYGGAIPSQVLYAEPKSYKEHPSPSSASYFDLTAAFDGLAPLPGFARLSGPPDEEKCLFVALLGFEGNRPSHLIVQVDPSPKVIPVVGVPGFQIEYPAFTVACNRDFLETYRGHDELRLARASCPFEVVMHLRELHRDYPEHYLYIAPVGTKPHAVGAVLYALERPDMTELMFDHPVKKSGRTSGVGVIHVFDVDAVGVH